ncbi:MAG: poly-beta-1,6-N-acetyl-D-glucosamine biosynthesis protein PgaD [Pseudomonadales bacterium]|nr:poly-beta-1,6-N-acetyl-D-glucosamine biosynthesis protein PgaD [Pseudomonadales bacterium]MCP5183602.1 poly-beta-1,6-N-acetyl-D-glucosamine biosynthesis protein PgaD [Pseudomonadales bacterium]
MTDDRQQNGQRPLIIERPERQTAMQRWGWGGITAFAWVVWFYLVIPLLSLVAWVAGLYFLYTTLLQGLNLDDLPPLLIRYGIGIGILTGTYLLWALYCRLRFRRTKRRKASPPVSVDALAEYNMLTAADVAHWQAASRLVVDDAVLEQMFPRRRQRPETLADGR